MKSKQTAVRGPPEVLQAATGNRETPQMLHRAGLEFGPIHGFHVT